MFRSTNRFALVVIRFVYCLTISATVRGCGQLPSGRSVTIKKNYNEKIENFSLGRTLRFNVTGSGTIPAVMAFTTEANVLSQVPSISRNEQAAKAFVQNLIMSSVEDVLERQGRSALLADAVISLILQQFAVNMSYTPIRCNTVSTNIAVLVSKVPRIGYLLTRHL